MITASQLPSTRQPVADIRPPKGTTIGSFALVTPSGEKTAYDLVSVSRATDDRLLGAQRNTAEMMHVANDRAQKRLDHNEGTTFAVLRAFEGGPTSAVEVFARPSGVSDAKAAPFLIQDLVADGSKLEVDFPAGRAGGIHGLASGELVAIEGEPGQTKVGSYWSFHTILF